MYVTYMCIYIYGWYRLSPSLLLTSLELSDAKVCEP